MCRWGSLHPHKAHVALDKRAASQKCSACVRQLSTKNNQKALPLDTSVLCCVLCCVLFCAVLCCAVRGVIVGRRLASHVLLVCTTAPVCLLCCESLDLHVGVWTVRLWRAVRGGCALLGVALCSVVRCACTCTVVRERPRRVRSDRSSALRVSLCCCAVRGARGRRTGWESTRRSAGSGCVQSRESCWRLAWRSPCTIRHAHLPPSRERERGGDSPDGSGSNGPAAPNPR